MTNRMYVLYRMALLPMTLSDIEGHFKLFYRFLNPTSRKGICSHLFCLSNSKSSNTIKFFFSGLNSRGSGTSLAFSKNLHSISDYCV